MKDKNFFLAALVIVAAGIIYAMIKQPQSQIGVESQ